MNREKPAARFRTGDGSGKVESVEGQYSANPDQDVSLIALNFVKRR